VTRKKKKISLDKAARKLAAIAEGHLAKLPEEERDSRVEALARREFRSGRGKHTKSSENDRTPAYPVAARGRE
jgi:hypothetical protein